MVTLAVIAIPVYEQDFEDNTPHNILVAHSR